VKIVLGFQVIYIAHTPPYGSALLSAQGWTCAVYT